MIETPIVVIAAPSIPEDNLMLLVDCPLCDTASPFDAAEEALDCPRCHVRLVVAADEGCALAEAA